MIRALELENFKAFGKRTRIPFAPITLIYGQNSAGKSSVLNALNLLKQTRQSRDRGALLLPRAESGLVDLGSFHELLHDHDLTQTLMIRIELERRPRPRRVARDIEEEPRYIGFEVGFRREQDMSDVSLAFLQAYDPSVASQPVVQFEPTEVGEAEEREMTRFVNFTYFRANRQIPSRKFTAVKCTAITSTPEFWSKTYKDARKAKADIVRSLKMLRKEFENQTEQMRPFGDVKWNQGDIKSAIDFYGSSFTLEDFIERRRNAQLGKKIAMDGFIPTPTPGETSTRYPEDHAIRWYERKLGPRRASMFFDATDFISFVGRSVEIELERLFPLGPYRRAPERLYIFTGTTPTDVGYSGKLLPDLLFRRPQLVDETNWWLDRLDIGYHIQISPVGTPSNDLYEVRLLDKKRSASTSIALPDVGFGISQILPLIVQTLASQNQTITIEQPEVHIHPKLQADLADLLIAGIQAKRNHRFVVETHSEHLILRLLRRIRETTEGTLPDEQPGVTTDDVSVVYLQRGGEGTDVHHIRIDQSGEFIDRWPQGFFAERMKELL